MSPLQEQLAALRAKIAQIDRKYATEGPARSRTVVDPATPLAPSRSPVRYEVEDWLSGGEVETRCGKHFETERLYESHRRHGSADVGALNELPADLLCALSGQEIAAAPPSSWCFLDTETTGLAGGTGTYAFLIGVGRITPEGFHLRQFFMRDFGEEASLLFALAEYLGQFQVMITYNGRTYDQPLLETRYRLARTRPPFAALQHLDLLTGARRLWKLRLDSCRLVHLEQQILGVERIGDLPGELIPYVYFDYVRKQEALKIAPILHHNALDILSLACITAIVPSAFQHKAKASYTHGADMLGVARWLRSSGEHQESLDLLDRALQERLPDALTYRAMWESAMILKKLKREAEAVPRWEELATFANPHQLDSLVELAKWAERGAKDHQTALAYTRRALALREDDGLRSRELRLTARLTKKPLTDRQSKFAGSGS